MIRAKFFQITHINQPEKTTRDIFHGAEIPKKADTINL